MTTVFNKDVTDINEPKAKGTLTLEAKKSAANLPYERSGEFIDIDGRTFMQLSDFAHDSSEPGAEIRTKTLEAVKNTWLEADSNAQAIELSDALFGASLDMKRFNTAGGNLVIGNIDESTQRKLLEYREKQKVYAIDKAERTTLEGHQAVKYQIRTSEDKLRKYNAELYPQTSAQGVQEDDPTSYAESFVLYVDRSTELPLRLEYSVQGTEVVVEYSNFNQPLAISKPKDAKVASEVVGGLSASQGTGSTSVKDEVDVTQRLDFAQEEVFRGDVFNASIESLKPDSKAQIMLVVGSDYISLGEFTVDGEGILNAEIVIPEDATTGFHELHIYATHPSESRTDFYQFLTVLGSEEDVDGDGIPNETDKCSFVEPADVDEDGDGIDDACDPLIG